MSTRNPLNERYQNTDDRAGKTRKSAASAKPVSKAASSVHVQGKTSEEPKGLLARATKRANKNASKKQNASKETVERRKEQALRSKYYNPDTPEYKKWRKVWWGMLAGAIACTALSFFASGTDGMTGVTYVFIVLSYVLLIGAIVLDFTHIRKLRNEYQDRMIAEEKSKKNSAKRKEAAAEARRSAKESEEAANQEQPEEERKLFRGLFTRKRASDAVATAKSAQARAAAETSDDAGNEDSPSAESPAGTDVKGSAADNAGK